MPMNVTNNCVQDSKPITHKRKAEDYFLVDNSKSPRSCLMLDMYTQTDRLMSGDVSLMEIYDLVRKNSEHLQKVEEMVLKLPNILETSEHTLYPVSRTHGQVSTSFPVKNVSSTSHFQAQSPQINTRAQFIATHDQGIPVSNSSFSSDYVTQVSEIGDWDGSQVRHDLASAVSSAPLNTETRLVGVNSTLTKTSIKEDWSCENGSIAVSDQPSGPGCWLGDVNDVNRRAWFSGDPKVIERCESYGANPVKLALSLTEALFTREEMAASNVRGTRGKETLDPSKIKAIRAHVDYKYPIEEADRMEVRWQLIKPKLDSKCRSQRRLQREHKWKFERLIDKPATTSTPKQKRPVLDVEEREMLLYGSPKTVINPAVVSVYTESTADPTSSFSERQEGYLQNAGE